MILLIICDYLSQCRLAACIAMLYFQANVKVTYHDPVELLHIRLTENSNKDIQAPI